MLRATLKDLLARKLRLVATSVAVLLGVAFMTGGLVLTDTIVKTFDDLFTDVYAGTDAYVRSSSSLETDFGGEVRSRLDEAVVEQVATIEGVRHAVGEVQAYTQIVGRDGEPVGDFTGPPTFGTGWHDIDEVNSFSLHEGRAPATDDEVVIDKDTAEAGDLAVGDRTRALTQSGPVEVTVSGIARFGEADSPGGASFVMFRPETAQRLLGEPGKVDAVQVVGDEGLSEEEVRDRVAAGLTGKVEVLTGSEIAAEEQDAIEEGVGFFGQFMFVFALIVLFVGSFIIYNTFSIVVAQRTRELALLRAVGATRRQVIASVVLEALAAGVLASLVGLGGGLAVAGLLKGLLGAVGFDIPAGGLVLTGGTVVAALVAGIGVSLAAAVIPARRASRVPPVAAMRDVAVDPTGTSRRRLAAGLAVLGLGVAALVAGLAGGGNASLVGLGAAVVFLGVAVLGPSIALPVTRVVSWPLPRLRGVPGHLARTNAMRNPRRTSATAAALMIGVGLVGFIAVFAASARATLDRTIDRAFVADFVVDSGSWGFGGLSTDLAPQIAALPEVDAVSPLRNAAAELDGRGTFLQAVDATSFGQVVDVAVTSGELADLGTDGLALSQEAAERDGLTVGDEVTVRFAETGEKTLTVEAIFGEDLPLGDRLIDLSLFDANVGSRFDTLILVRSAEGVDDGATRRAIEGVASAHPTADVQDLTEYKRAQAEQFEQVLTLVYALLALAVVVALIGIANTLALSVLERTRELGLLRAVGMTRGQLRSAVRWEAVVVALLGAVLGLAVGLFFGWAMVTSLRDEGFSDLRIPGGQLLAIAAVAGLAGLLAAVMPARRAARLDVLTAIAAE